MLDTFWEGGFGRLFRKMFSCSLASTDLYVHGRKLPNQCNRFLLCIHRLCVFRRTLCSRYRKNHIAKVSVSQSIDSFPSDGRDFKPRNCRINCCTGMSGNMIVLNPSKMSVKVLAFPCCGKIVRSGVLSGYPQVLGVHYN